MTERMSLNNADKHFIQQIARKDTEKTLPDVGEGPLLDAVREYHARPENAFDALPLDQQIVRLKLTVDYLVRRLTEAEQAQRWATFLADWVDYNHGKGEADRAWEEFLDA